MTCDYVVLVYSHHYGCDLLNVGVLASFSDIFCTK